MNEKIILIGALFTISCGQTEDKTSNSTSSTPATKTTKLVDTSGLFIRKLLNSSPQEVAKYIGKPDTKIKPSTDCDYLPACNEASYQNKKYEVLYYNNKLKWIEINNIDVFNETAIQYVGFPASEPTFANKFMIHWRSAATRGTATGPLFQWKAYVRFPLCLTMQIPLSPLVTIIKGILLLKLKQTTIENSETRTIALLPTLAFIS